MPDDASPPEPDKIPMTPADAGVHLAGLAQVEARRSSRQRDWGRFAQLAAYMIQEAYDAGGGIRWKPIDEDTPKDRPLLLFARARGGSGFVVLVGWRVEGDGWIEGTFEPNRPVGVVPLLWADCPRPGPEDIPTEGLVMPVVQRRFRCETCRAEDPEANPEALVDADDLALGARMRCARCGGEMQEVEG